MSLNDMEIRTKQLGPYWKAASRSATQEFFSPLWSRMFITVFTRAHQFFLSYIVICMSAYRRGLDW
jgi:hypothetical protein